MRGLSASLCLDDTPEPHLHGLHESQRTGLSSAHIQVGESLSLWGYDQTVFRRLATTLNAAADRLQAASDLKASDAKAPDVPGSQP